MRNALRVLLVTAALAAGMGAAPAANAASMGAASVWHCSKLTPVTYRFEVGSPLHWFPEGASLIKGYTEKVNQTVLESCVNDTYGTLWYQIGRDPYFIWDGYRI